MRELTTGDVVRLRKFKTIYPNDIGRVELTFEHPDKKRVFLFLLLGDAEIDADVKPDELLERMGWKYVGINAGRT